MSKFRALAVFAVIIVAVAGWFLFASRGHARVLSGYIEGEDLYLAAPVSGTVGEVLVSEGQRVSPGQQIFRIDPATLTAQGEQASANLTAARTQIASAQAQAQQADADVAGANANLAKARQDLARLLTVKRADAAAVAGKDLDAARAAVADANSRLASAQKTADARRAQIVATRAQAAQARGGAKEIAIRVNQLSPAAPSAGLVESVFYQAGEWVNANQPVVALLPDNEIKVRFYVPEPEAARYRPGQTIHFSCDGCGGALVARIAYVSPRPEFTPPVIFSRDSRDRLVFMVEAYPSRATRLMPGLPVDVEPLQ